MSLSHSSSQSTWHTVWTETRPALAGTFVDPAILDPGEASRRLLAARAPHGLYGHQVEALASTLTGDDVCLATQTASGKTLVFHVAAVERLSRNPDARVLALYPLRALGSEQESRWRDALDAAGLDIPVGRIDGHVRVSSRARILKRSGVLVMTPDVLHAWLLSNLSDPEVQKFLRDLSLVVVDEVHAYSGVFGTHAAFLLRRLQRAAALCGGTHRYIAASATMARESEHIETLFGRPMHVVGAESDTSPRHEIEMSFEAPTPDVDFLTSVTEYLRDLVRDTDHRFICFVDSRKSTEQIASILARRAAESEEGEESCGHGDDDVLDRLDILPFRAGYEDADRERIQARLTDGTLRGVVSTSALELGLDIPHLSAAVLVGVPRSSTSLLQRIGRVGRNGPGRVLLLHGGDAHDEAVFNAPRRLRSLPFQEGALYVENRRVQFIHALCIAREHEQAGGAEEFSSPVPWPDGFVSLFESERLGQVPADLQSLKLEGADDPHHTFPIRDVEPQFKVELRGAHRMVESLGSLSHSQMMREAYPGAVYYYLTRPYRVTAVYLDRRIVRVREEKRYVTTPTCLPAQVFPNLTGEGTHRALTFGDLTVIDCDVGVRETIVGFGERRGRNRLNRPYPVDGQVPGVRYSRDRFTRNFFTTGTVLTHPALSDADSRTAATVSAIVREAFLDVVGYESRDVACSSDRHRTSWGHVEKGARFVAAYDVTYGSLRLTSRLLEVDTLRAVLERAHELAGESWISAEYPSTPEVVDVLRQLCDCAARLPRPLDLSERDGVAVDPRGGESVQVICPGSVGLALDHAEAEFEVQGIYFHPSYQALAYRGRFLTRTPLEGDRDISILRCDRVAVVPGETRTGRYFPDTAELVPDLDPAADDRRRDRPVTYGPAALAK